MSIMSEDKAILIISTIFYPSYKVFRFLRMLGSWKILLVAFQELVHNSVLSSYLVASSRITIFCSVIDHLLLKCRDLDSYQSYFQAKDEFYHHHLLMPVTCLSWDLFSQTVQDFLHHHFHLLQQFTQWYHLCHLVLLYDFSCV